MFGVDCKIDFGIVGLLNWGVFLEDYLYDIVCLKNVVVCVVKFVDWLCVKEFFCG